MDRDLHCPRDPSETAPSDHRRRAPELWLPRRVIGDGDQRQAPVDATPPRLGLAFILNDAAQDPEATTPTSDVATAVRPAMLPQRRPEGQWGSLASVVDQLGDVADPRHGVERSTAPLASPTWRTDAPLGDAAWGVGGFGATRATPTSRDPDPESREAYAAPRRATLPVKEEKADAQPTPRTTVPALSREEKRRGRTCRVEGCDNYIVHKGLCCRHGGARKCSTDGCESTAKYMGLCWKHGGSTWCKVDGCTKRAKAKGRCWAHGGGTQCSHDACTKVAVSSGLCWAHGGGKRCLFDGCNRPGYERTNGFCDRHFEEMEGVNYFEV